jgi:hypothetical protein
MAAIDFPSGAQSGDQHVSAGKTWTYNGSGWVLVTIPTAMFTADSVSGSALVDGTVGLQKIFAEPAGQIIVFNGSGVATAVDQTGDVTINTSGVTAISSGVIVNADINASAAIDKTKIAGTAVTVADSGTVTSAMIADSTIVDGDISATANIAQGKIADILTNAQGASYTLVLADKNKIVEMNVGSANDLTVPPNSSVAFPIGSQIQVLQTGAGKTRILAGAGVTVNATPGIFMRAQWSAVTLLKRGTDSWVATGDLSAS